MVGSKVMALFSCYSDLARQDLLFNDYVFNGYFKENGIQKVLKNFERDPTVGSKVMALFRCYSSLVRQDLLFNEKRFHRYKKENASGNYCKTLSAIQRSDNKLWPFIAVIPLWPDKTSSLTRRDYIGYTRK